MLGSVSLSAAGVVLGVLGILGAITAAVVIIIGSRAKTLATIQDQTITALDARVSDLESQLEQAIRREAANTTLLAERDRLIDSLRAQVKTLGDVVTSREAIEALSRQLANLPAAVAESVRAGR
jgi:predicted PurR-regulated permease PerM